MLKYVLIAIISYLLGIFTLVIFSVMRISLECSRKEEKQQKKFVDYGKMVYEDIEKLEKEKKDNV